MSNSDCLRNAKNAKNDEFYTLLTDLEYELTRPDYAKQLEGKTVYCNCDNPEWSNFFVFFKLHFKQLKMKKLITTHYNKDDTPSYKIEWCGEMLNDDMVNLIKTPLKGNGDFRSDECIEILKEADIVVTNPPFSLYREYVSLLIEYDKKFIIIGNKNSIAYKEIFPLLKDGKMFVGYNAGKGTMHFATKIINNTDIGEVTHSVPSYWFTNLDIDKSHEPLILTKNYYGNESRYPKYDNYDAIECSKVKDIPKDYFPCWYDCPHSSTCEYAKTEGKEKDKALCEMARNGEIGVPITYMAKHCEEQFEILGSDNDFARNMKDIAEEGTYEKGGPSFYLNNDLAHGRFYVKKNYKYQRLYSRLVIRRM